MFYDSDNWVALDFETTNLEYGDARNPSNKIVYAHWYNNHTQSHHSVRGNEYELGELINHIEQTDFVIAQNAKFELQWLARCGVDISKVTVYDTMIAEYVIAGNRPWKLNLGEIHKRYGGDGKEPFVDMLMKSGVCPSEIPASMLADRCKKDVSDTIQIFFRQMEILKESDLLPVLHTRCSLTPVLADIEANGMCLDAKRVRQEYLRNRKEVDSITSKLIEVMGDINPNSSKQMCEYMYDVLKFDEARDWRGKPLRTAKDGRKAGADIIAQLVATTPEQQQFKELKLQQSKVEAERKILEKMNACVEQDGGILYANFNQCVSRTHRLTSSGTRHKIQFQNLARAFKPLFTARHPDYEVGEADGAQLEFRVAVFNGRDTQGLKDILNNEDVHSNTAKAITDAGQTTNRQEAKEHTFKPLYGGESGTPAEQSYYKWFKDRYDGIAKTQQRWIDEVVNNKKLVTCTGLTFYWPDTTVQRSGYVTNRESICNYPVQSLATADIIPIAIVGLWHRMKELNMKSFLVNTVHDSVIAEVHKDERELFVELVVQSFTTHVYEYLEQVYGLEWFVPLAAGVKIANNWSEGEEVKYESKPPYELTEY